MARGQLTEVFRQLRRAALLSDGGGMTDGQLLECYLTRQDEAAFEALVRRHGPMVLGVCRRVLGNPHDAEDAFQATFLVLTRKAPTIRPRDRVGNWLYGVAYRTALKARAMRARRWAKERQLIDAPGPEVDASRQELHLLLDRALHRLPEKYREPLVLCDLEGKSRRQVAQQLGCPEGTVATRLAKARRMLAQRLAPYGLPVSVGSVAVLCAQDAASATVPVPLAISTVKAVTTFAVGQATTPNLVSVRVAALTGAVLKGMFMSKVKMVGAFMFVVSVIGLGVGMGSYQLVAGEEADAKKPAPERHTAATVEKPPIEDESKVNGRLPTSGSFLLQALVSLPGDGQLAVTRVVINATSRKEATPDGIKIITEYTNRLHTEYWDLAEVEVLNNTGKPIDKDQLPRLLKNEVLALIWLGSDPFDPLHLRVVKDGILVFVLPSHATPAPIPIAPPPLRPAPSGHTAHATARVGQILIVGNEKTGQKAILNALSFFPGQVIKPADLRKAEENLERLDSIARATVRVLKSTEDFQDILVTVTEK
jgi:RNA polymerase sigma factor (sigma-70 family)